jgi:hypothetical protein
MTVFPMEVQDSRKNMAILTELVLQHSALADSHARELAGL